MTQDISKIVKHYQCDKTRLIDMLWDIQRAQGYISDQAVAGLATSLNMSAGDIRETLSFYHFFIDKPSGKFKIYLANTVIAKMKRYQEVRAALELATGASFGATDASGTFTLQETNCIGLSDQEPAILINDVAFTQLTATKVAKIISHLKAGKPIADIATPVQANIQQSGPILLQQNIDYKAVLARCKTMTPDAVIGMIEASGLRGRGGAGFPTALKWRFCQQAEGSTKHIICNADEGEPGTFKDRVLLSESPKDVFIGMAINAHATGASNGILYLRVEYYYLRDVLETALQELRNDGLLGIDFDIRIQFGAGAYICGEETAMIESCEGKRGTPRLKPPFPVQQGYLGQPTSINNVETLACVTRIMEKGAVWFKSYGTATSSGTRLLSVSGDCSYPGIYEIEWGITLNQVLTLVGANKAKAVQVSGPAGDCLSVIKDGDRQLAFEDISCNGSLMIFDQSRDLLAIIRDFMQFFVDESCGICTPCRVGNVDLLAKVDRLIAGQAGQQDLDQMISWSKMISSTSRCGLGNTSPRPILTSLNKFPEIYQQKLVKQQGTLLASFDPHSALREHDAAYQKLTGGQTP